MPAQAEPDTRVLFPESFRELHVNNRFRWFHFSFSVTVLAIVRWRCQEKCFILKHSSSSLLALGTSVAFESSHRISCNVKTVSVSAKHGSYGVGLTLYIVSPFHWTGQVRGVSFVPCVHATAVATQCHPSGTRTSRCGRVTRRIAGASCLREYSSVSSAGQEVV